MSYAPSDFQRESYRIDERIWETLALRAGERVLMLGLANDGAWVRRALEVGVSVDVLGGDNDTIARIGDLGATAIRGSAMMIPATDGAYDVAVAFHYLHEIDPGFHAQVISQLARVGRRVAIVEPSPPADPLGRRIASLYARAKRDAGLFEQYQPIEYWRKFLAMAKAEVWQQLFTFTRVPPRHAVAETVTLILDAMAMEDLPQTYLDELRQIAARPDAQLLPLSRIVLIGTPAGESLPNAAGTKFRPDLEHSAPAVPSEPVAAAPAPPPPAAVPAALSPAPFVPPPAAVTHEPLLRWPTPEAPELPPAPPAPAALPSPAPPPGPFPNGFETTAAGMPPGAETPFGAPFATPEPGEAATPGGFGWAWEPPEGGEGEKPG